MQSGLWDYIPKKDVLTPHLHVIYGYTVPQHFEFERTFQEALGRHRTQLWTVDNSTENWLFNSRCNNFYLFCFTIDHKYDTIISLGLLS